MRIEGLPPAFARINAPSPASNKSDKAPEDVPPVADTPPVPVSDDNDSSEKGVIHLLNEGHFKGVADVRLRINFHDELTTTENKAAGAVIDGHIGNIAESLTETAVPLIEAGEFTEEQFNSAMETFQQEAGQVVDEFKAAASPSEETLATGLTSAFDNLIASISPAPDNDEPADPDAPSSESTDQSSTELLTAAFQSALADLIEGLNDVPALPELSEPNGQGKAYDKFLGIYNDLQGIVTSDEDPEPDTPIDITT